MENIQIYKQKLEERKKYLEEEIKKLNVAADFGDDGNPMDEEADESEEYVNQSAVAQDFKKDLVRINDALVKMENGKYGICEKCKGWIEKEILDVEPESAFCKECKKAH